MTNDFKDKKHNDPAGPLEDILQGAGDEKERLRLTKAWSALSGLTAETCAVPTPSRELARIFKKGAGGQPLDEPMGEDELELLAAAGTEHPASHGEVGIPGSPPGCIVDNGWKSGSCPDGIAHGGDCRMIPKESGSEDIFDKDDDAPVLSGSDTDVLTAGAGSDVFYFSSFEGAETIPDFTPGEDSLQFGEGLTPDTMFISLNDAGDIVVNFPGSMLTLDSVRGGDWGLHSDMGSGQMTEVFLGLGWTDFISAADESE